jgi:Fe/S biogenesis protein NfuA
MSQIIENLLAVTDEARAIVVEALANEPASEGLALWIEVRGVEAGKFIYDLYFQSVADSSDDDAVVESQDLTIVIPGPSVSRLTGARLEFSSDGGGGLVMINPNTPSPAEFAPGVPPDVIAQGLGGPLAVRVIEVLESDVNPSIASHGGRADLVGFDEAGGIAYLALSGGCQGCAMSRATLSQGIEVTLRDQIAELVEIVDVTDHAQGTTPFYSG